jgi:CRISPR-associated exonuclease Cas4
MLYLVPLLVLIALVLFWIASRQRRAAGLPAGRVIYADTSRWSKVEKPLYDSLIGLTGKPDYLIEQSGRLIPVEVKSSRVSQAPYDGHIFQLAAYCLLSQRAFGKRPPHGILHYPNRTFAIDYTTQLEASLLEILTDMRQNENKKDIRRSHASPARCQRCGFRTMCDQALK